MVMTLCSEVLKRLEGKTLVTAESLTGGGIGNALTAVPGASAVYKGGVISYVNEVKRDVLGVSQEILDRYGAVSPWTAGAMASGVRKLLKADYAVSVTGLAGPTGDEFGNPVGTVYIGIASARGVRSERFQAPDPSTRESVRNAAAVRALELLYGEGRLLVN